MNDFEKFGSRKMLKYLISCVLLVSISLGDCEYMYGQYYTFAGNFDFEEYVFGEDNCCDDYPIPMCGDDRIYFEKDDYADYNDPDNWDIVSPYVALTRGDRRGLYNPLVESEYVYGATPWEYQGISYPSPENTLWNIGPRLGIYLEYGGWFSWGYYGNVSDTPLTYSMFSVEDDAYYDFYVTSWTRGDGLGSGWGGDGNGSAPGGGFSYYRSGPIDYKPTITSIEDVPNDQGGRVYLTFRRCEIDVNSHPYGINNYSVQRLDGSTWVDLGTVNALGQPSYTYEATTLIDSTGNVNQSSTFRVIAANYNINLTFFSEEYNGYSVDNVPPGVPNGLNAVWEDSQVYISWNSSIDEDFQYYNIEKDTDAAFLNAEAFNTSESFFVDQDVDGGMIYYYRVRSIDDAENFSDFSEVVQTLTLSNEDLAIPNRFYLHQNYPNPFNPTTAINYDMQNDGHTIIEIMDVRGNYIRTLINDYVQMGSKYITWDATNDHGERVPAGIYFYTLRTNNYIQTQKMVLLK